MCALISACSPESFVSQHLRQLVLIGSSTVIQLEGFLVENRLALEPIISGDGPALTSDAVSCSYSRKTEAMQLFTRERCNYKVAAWIDVFQRFTGLPGH